MAREPRHSAGPTEGVIQKTALQSAQKSQVAMRITKALINRAAQVDFFKSEKLEIVSAIVNATSEDCMEEMADFNENRNPVFKGR